MKLLVAIAILLATRISEGPIYDNPASDMKSFCKAFSIDNSPPSIEKAYCRGYIVGWFGAEVQNSSLGFEDGIKDEQIARVLLAYIKNHPEEENKPTHDVLMRAMKSANLVVTK
jgi:hypothetical protein